MVKKNIKIDKDLSILEKRIKYCFKDQKLLIQALIHRSYLNENPKFPLEHNERLEFLGDAVLELIVTEHLYNNYSNPEGELTNWRASLVNSKMLSQVAKEIDLEPFLFLSKGEAKDTGSKARNYILADTVEALIGAIYLDQGIKKVGKFIHKNIIEKLPEILKYKLYLDPKSKFQEIAQRKRAITPNYKVIKETGPDHLKKFEVGLYLNKELIATGKGHSKQEAQIKAAASALKKKEWNE